MLFDCSLLMTLLISSEASSLQGCCCFRRGCHVSAAVCTKQLGGTSYGPGPGLPAARRLPTGRQTGEYGSQVTRHTISCTYYMDQCKIRKVISCQKVEYFP